MDTKIRSDVRADPPSARAFPEIKHETKLEKNPSTSKAISHNLQQILNLSFKGILKSTLCRHLPTNAFNNTHCSHSLKAFKQL